MISLAALPASEAASTGVLAALGPIGAVADMAMMAFGSSFSAQMTRYAAQRAAMTPQQVRAESAMLQSQKQEASNLARRAVGSRILSIPKFVAQRAPQGGNVGFLSGLSKVFGGVGTAISDVRGIASSIGAAIHPAASAAGKAATVALDTAGSAAKAVGAAARAHPVLAAAGVGSAAAAGIAAGTMGGSTAAGKMVAKQHLKNLAKGLGIHHKRMHVTNTKALHRALRRVKGFERVARRVLQITHHKPVKVHFKFRKHRRAA